MRASWPPAALLIATASGTHALARSFSPRPSAIRVLVALGESWMPAPASERCPACSSRVTRNPDRASISAVVSPPMPAPAMMTLRDDATARAERSGRFGQSTGLWPRRVRVERRIVPVQRRAIRADDLFVVAHIEKNVRMSVGGPGADAHEFPCADLDDGDARIVVEVRDDVFGHDFAWNFV